MRGELISMMKLRKLINECEQMVNDCGYKVPTIEYKLNSRLSRTLGRCSKRSSTKWLIEIGTDFYQGCIASGNVELVKQTLLHEICHSLPNGLNHGEVWKRYADNINNNFGYDISRLTSVPNEVKEYSIKDGVLVCCDKCNREILTKRNKNVVKNPSVYTCKCGGKIFIKEI